MEFTCAEAKIGSGPAGAGLEGTLTIDRDGITFVPRNDPAKPLHWDLPGAKMPSTVLRVLPFGTNTVLHIGALDDITGISLTNAAASDVNRALGALGVPPGISDLTRAALFLRSTRAWAPLWVLVGLLPVEDPAHRAGRLLLLGVGLGSLLASHRIGLCLVNALALACFAGRWFLAEGLAFWPVLFSFLAYQSFSVWWSARPHVAVAENAEWMRALLQQVRPDSADRPAGWFARTLALGIAGYLFFTILPLIAVLPLVAFRQPFALVHVGVYMLGVLWYLGVCAVPGTMAGFSRKILGSGGPILMILVPWVLHGLLYELAYHASKFLVAFQKL